MLFNSLQFIVFYAIVFLLFFSIPARGRWVVLLTASYAFYMGWRPEYAILLFASTFVNYLCALGISSSKDEKKRYNYLRASLFFSLGLLFYYKYYGFFSTNTNAALELLGVSLRIPLLNVLLPVGISFFTLQAIGYTIDVYWGLIKPERHFGKFALYVSFFPQLVAGPIEKASHLLPQFRTNDQKFSWDRLVSGISQFLWGLFKKVVLADTLAIYVEAVYSTHTYHSTETLYVATAFFAIQVYCDFSGYSDMAIGAARILGYSLLENFKLPYFSRSIKEFWTRWHVSLYDWLRIYVYTPLSFRWMRMQLKGILLAVLLTFTISGAWHGAGWTFVLFGFYHGVAVILESWYSRKWPSKRTGKISHVLGSLYVLHVWMISLVLFRSPNLNFAISYYKHALQPVTSGLAVLDANVFAAICANLALLFAVEFFVLRHYSFDKLTQTRRWWLLALNQLLLFCVILFGNSSGDQFIYFQF